MSNFRGFGPGGGQHYDPNQPRVPAGDTSHHGGRWTGGGVELASAATTALGIRGAPFFAPVLAPALRVMLTRIAGAAVGPLSIVGGILLIPTNRSLVNEGALRDSPDIRYRHDAGTGYLTLWQDVPGDNKPLLFHGPADADGLYRLPDGAVIGRNLGDGILLNEEAAGKETRRKATARSGATAEAKDKVKLCPDPVPDRPNNRNIDWKLYQIQISGLPMGKAVVLR